MFFSNRNYICTVLYGTFFNTMWYEIEIAMHEVIKKIIFEITLFLIKAKLSANENKLSKTGFSNCNIENKNG